MALPGQHSRARKASSLLARYSDTFGEMQLRKYTERAIRAARAEAELNSRSKSAFLSTMSHELKTPLNAIIGFSDLMKTGATRPDEAADYALHIANAGRRLLEVVSDVLDMSRLESGSLSLDRRECLIGEVLEIAVENAQPLFVAKHQVIDLRLEPGLHDFEGDTKRLRQLFANLLSNASKFTPEKGRILVMAKAAKDSITIAIADTGVGMTHEQIVLALKPFAQVEAHLARTQEGTGLGLPLAMGIVKLHGGSLHLDSQPGEGTTAIVTLPRSVQRAATTRSAIGKVA
ncbi:MAG: Signal transduction histidine kinase [Alphaproteobacteria bacterium]|nr:Signal transduction histidine kinase [Alphaproteobacteria bacterium]MDB5740817.1 Signal transduction histidine kinase [Alphaproteobacteria bacterium]